MDQSLAAGRRSPLGMSRRSSRSKPNCTRRARTAAGMAPCRIVALSFRLQAADWIGSP